MRQALEHAVGNFWVWTAGQFTTVNGNIRRFGGTIQGGFARQNPATQQTRCNTAQEAVQQNNNGGDDGPGSTTLSRTPRTLLELWNEYLHGIAGQKPAKNFTREECNKTQGGIKQKYYRRKVVWDMISAHIRAGHTAQNAIHRIRSCYGFQMSVTQILNKMLYDRRTQPGGCHPNLAL